MGTKNYLVSYLWFLPGKMHKNYLVRLHDTYYLELDKKITW